MDVLYSLVTTGRSKLIMFLVELREIISDRSTQHDKTARSLCCMFTRLPAFLFVRAPGPVRACVRMGVSVCVCPGVIIKCIHVALWSPHSVWEEHKSLLWPISPPMNAAPWVRASRIYCTSCLHQLTFHLLQPNRLIFMAEAHCKTLALLIQ